MPDPWTCPRCGRRYVTESLRRDCELRHDRDEEQTLQRLAHLTAPYPLGDRRTA